MTTREDGRGACGQHQLLPRAQPSTSPPLPCARAVHVAPPELLSLMKISRTCAPPGGAGPIWWVVPGEGWGADLGEDSGPREPPLRQGRRVGLKDAFNAAHPRFRRVAVEREAVAHPAGGAAAPKAKGGVEVVVVVLGDHIAQGCYGLLVLVQRPAAIGAAVVQALGVGGVAIGPL